MKGKKMEWICHHLWFVLPAAAIIALLCIYIRFYWPHAEEVATLPPQSIAANAPVVGKKPNPEVTPTATPTKPPRTATATHTPHPSLYPDAPYQYHSETLDISIRKERYDNSNIYIADVLFQSAKSVRSAFANDQFGRSIRELTSDMAQRNHAILAINGDYYGYRDNGIIVRGGELYRLKPTRDFCCLFTDGTMRVYDEKAIDINELLSKGLLDTFSFGPSLLTEEGKARERFPESDVNPRNPRTAIGMIGQGHYVFVVADGRLEESEGITLASLSTLMENIGCRVAYNLDGGGSTAMVFQGKLVNTPCGGVRGLSGIGGERSVSDILYVAEP